MHFELTMKNLLKNGKSCITYFTQRTLYYFQNGDVKIDAQNITDMLEFENFKGY